MVSYCKAGVRNDYQIEPAGHLNGPQTLGGSNRLLPVTPKDIGEYDALWSLSHRCVLGTRIVASDKVETMHLEPQGVLVST
jgi:hypothetical protein